MKFTCEFCNRLFVTNSSLKRHVKTANYCLKIQNKNNCGDTLQKHENKVHIFEIQRFKEVHTAEIQRIKETYAAEIKRLEETVVRLEDRLQELAGRPTTVNTNNITNLAVFNLTQKHAQDVFNEKLEFKHIKNGLAGIADFSYEHLLKQEDGTPMYVCTDPSRGAFHYIDPATRARDMEAHVLIQIISDPVTQKSKEIFNDRDECEKDFYRDKFTEIKCINKNARPLWRRMAVLAAE